MPPRFPSPIVDHIIHEADGLIVVDKPAGLPSTGATLEDPGCVQHQLMEAYRRKIWAVHQLDADTSGVNLFVRRKALVAEWSTRLARDGTKRYTALCAGVPSFDEKRIDAPLGWIASKKRRGICADGDAAMTRVEVGARGEDACLLSVTLETGRTHQIRIHLASIGHPVLGEARYVSPPCRRHMRQALHAGDLVFRDGPRFHSPLPGDLRALMERLGLDHPLGDR